MDNKRRWTALPGFTLVEYLAIFAAILLLPGRFVPILIAAVVLFQLGGLGLNLLYRKWFTPLAGDSHASDP